MSRNLRLGLLICAVLTGSPGAATNFACPAGVITYLGMTSDGVVTLTTTNSGLNANSICSVNATFLTVGADTCKSWYSGLLSQRAQGKAVVLYFDSNNSSIGGLTSCMPFGGWTTRVPYFMQFEN